MKILFFDCGAGIAGDMTIAALLELGLPLEHLRQELANLPLAGYQLNTEPCRRHGLAANRFCVTVSDDHPHRRYTDIKAMIEESFLDEGVKAKAQQVFL